MAKKEIKKALRGQIEKILTAQFSNIKVVVGEKKFLKKIKKAGKILAAGASVNSLETVPEKTKPVVAPKKAKAVRKAAAV